MAKRTTIDLSDADIERLHYIMQQYGLPSESAALRWAVQTVADAIEIVIHRAGTIIRYSRSEAS